MPKNNNVNVPLSSDERKALEKLADAESRSLAGQMRHLLQKHIFIMNSSKTLAAIKKAKAAHE